MMAFEVRLRTDDGTEYTLSEELSVGRSDDCDIILPSSKVSRQHARFRVTDGIVSIEDLGSSNGTRLNGNAIDSAQALMNGDSVRIDAYTLTVSIAPAPSVTDAANVSPPRDSYAPGPASSADEPPVAETTLAREPEPEPEPEPQPAHGPEADAVLEPEPDPEPEPAAEPAAEGAAPASRLPLYIGGVIALGIVIVAAAMLL